MIRAIIATGFFIIPLLANGEIAPSPLWFNSGLNNRDLTISPIDSMMATTVMSPANHFGVIMISTKSGGEWQPLSVAPFSGVYPDIEPMFTPDGARLWFASKRPKPNREGDDWDLWYVERRGDGFGEPVNPGAPINTPANEFYPSITQTGRVYFTGEREGGAGREDIFRAVPDEAGYSVEALGAGVNTAGFEFNAFVTPDERMIVFSAQGREGGFGSADLYVARGDGAGAFEDAALLPAGINSEGLDYCPFIHEGTLYFTTRRFNSPGTLRTGDDVLEAFGSPGNGLGDVMRVPLDVALP